MKQERTDSTSIVTNFRWTVYRFVDTAFGSPRRRNNVVDIADLAIPTDTPDCFTSLYRFGAEYKQLCEETGSVKGAAKLRCYSDYLWFDIDACTLTDALEDARGLVRHIEEIDHDLTGQLSIYFSGAKGFHIGVPADLFGWEPSVDLPNVHKSLAKQIAGDIPIDSTIYEHNRLWRIPNTKNRKSGLFKVPLTIDQLLDWEIDEIKRHASTPTDRPTLPPSTSAHLAPNERLSMMYQEAVSSLRKPQPQGSAHLTSMERPCYRQLLQGVDKGKRNEAAIRLATAWKKAGETPDRTLLLLSEWNQHNRPPLPDQDLEPICRSAFEGPYDYGCNDPLLAALCDSSCELKRKSAKPEAKKVRYAACVTLGDGSVTEQLFDHRNPSLCCFATYHPDGDGCDAYDGYLDTPAGLVAPYPADTLLRLPNIHFPSAVGPYESDEQLRFEVSTFIGDYVATSEEYKAIAVHYVFLTWVHDRHSELPYLRVIGGWGTGKSRFLKTIGSLCYRPIFCMGVSSPASLFRLLDSFRGTLVLDESDFENSDESHRIVKMLNTGYQKGFPLTRTEKRKDGTFEVISYDVYGPKIIATRREFKDQALESRCLTERMDGKVRTGLPVSISQTFWDRAQHLRNKLLAWRFRNYNRIQPSTAVIDLKIQPRLAQIINPLLSVVSDERTKANLIEFIMNEDSRFREDRANTIDGRIVRALLRIQSNGNPGYVSIEELTEEVNRSIPNDRYKLTNVKVGRLVNRTLGLPRERTGRERRIVLNSDKARERLEYWCKEFGLGQE